MGMMLGTKEADPTKANKNKENRIKLLSLYPKDKSPCEVEDLKNYENSRRAKNLGKEW